MRRLLTGLHWEQRHRWPKLATPTAPGSLREPGLLRTYGESRCARWIAQRFERFERFSFARATELRNTWAFWVTRTCTFTCSELLHVVLYFTVVVAERVNQQTKSRLEINVGLCSRISFFQIYGSIIRSYKLSHYKIEPYVSLSSWRTFSIKFFNNYLIIENVSHGSKSGVTAYEASRPCSPSCKC